MGDRYPTLKFGVFAAVCLGFAAWLIAMIGNIALFENRVAYAAEFEDVTGLLVNDAVKVSGVTVGKVTGIELLDGGTARVQFEVRDDVAITEDSQVSVRWRDVFGLRFLYLHPGEGPAVEPQHVFPLAQTSSPADLGALLQRLTPVIQALDPDVQNELLEGLQRALVGQEREIRQLITDGASLTQAIASRDDEIGRLLTNSGRLLEAYANREEQLRGMLRSFADVSETLAARNDVLDRAITTIADGMAETGELVDRNELELRRTLDELEFLTGILNDHERDLELILTHSARGLVTYHKVSRLGQWFNIRAVGVSANYDEVTAERGARLPPLRDGGDQDSTAFFTVPDGEAD